MPIIVNDAAALEDLRRRRSDLVLLDVRLEDDHAAARLPGAVGNCVFEVAFGKRMDELAPETGTPVCVYGHGPDSAEAAVAAEKLERAGYEQVHVFAPGLDGWRRAGRDCEGEGGPSTEPTWPTGRRELDLAACRVEWLGRNLLNRHWGTVAVARGHLDCVPEGLAGGEIVLDLTRLECDDLAGHELHDVLIDHLASDDFFDVERHPTARYVVHAGRWKADASPGAPNLEVRGELTLRGVTAPLDAVVAAGVGGDGVAGAQATLAIDRTRWGVNYGSGRLFRRLAGHLVNDQVELRLRLVLAPGEA